jgi:hypothetical protein
MRIDLQRAPKVLLGSGEIAAKRIHVQQAKSFLGLAFSH